VLLKEGQDDAEKLLRQRMDAVNAGRDGGVQFRNFAENRSDMDVVELVGVARYEVCEVVGGASGTYGRG
jgi:hypothetical protein